MSSGVFCESWAAAGRADRRGMRAKSFRIWLLASRRVGTRRGRFCRGISCRHYETSDLRHSDPPFAGLPEMSQVLPFQRHGVPDIPLPSGMEAYLVAVMDIVVERDQVLFAHGGEARRQKGCVVRDKMQIMKMDQTLLNRPVNTGFSGGEKKRNEIFQMAVLEPKLAVLDETDS